MVIDHIQQLKQQLESAEIVRAGLERAAMQHDQVAPYLSEARDAEAFCREELHVALREVTS
jgi:hypothetical protein